MNAETTNRREGSTFSSARYLASLMAELDRAAISARIRDARTKAGSRTGRSSPTSYTFTGEPWRTGRTPSTRTCRGIAWTRSPASPAQPSIGCCTVTRRQHRLTLRRLRDGSKRSRGRLPVWPICLNGSFVFKTTEKILHPSEGFGDGRRDAV